MLNAGSRLRYADDFGATSREVELDGEGYFGMARHKVYIVDVATGEHEMLYDRSPLGEYQYDWNPNSQEIEMASIQDAGIGGGG